MRGQGGDGSARMQQRGEREDERELRALGTGYRVPSAFSGRAHFLQEMDHLAESCRKSRPRPGTKGVRVPGERAMESMAEQEKNGVKVSEEALKRLAPWLEKTGVAIPEEMK